MINIVCKQEHNITPQRVGIENYTLKNDKTV